MVTLLYYKKVLVGLKKNWYMCLLLNFYRIFFWNRLVCWYHSIFFFLINVCIYLCEMIFAIFCLYFIHIDIGYECIVFSCVKNKKILTYLLTCLPLVIYACLCCQYHLQLSKDATVEQLKECISQKTFVQPRDVSVPPFHPQAIPSQYQYHYAVGLFRANVFLRRIFLVRIISHS